MRFFTLLSVPFHGGSSSGGVVPPGDEGDYFGARFFAPRFFGKRYFG